jgi:hypothetical protein
MLVRSKRWWMHRCKLSREQEENKAPYPWDCYAAASWRCAVATTAKAGASLIPSPTMTTGTLLLEPGDLAQLVLGQ